MKTLKSKMLKLFIERACNAEIYLISSYQFYRPNRERVIQKRKTQLNYKIHFDFLLYNYFLIVFFFYFKLVVAPKYPRIVVAAIII